VSATATATPTCARRRQSVFLKVVPSFCLVLERAQKPSYR
jgi:hypothetical protein